MTRYIIVRPFPGGLCYLVIQGIFPFIGTTFVPDINLATQFDTYNEALMIAQGIPGAMVEPVEVEDNDSDP